MIVVGFHRILSFAAFTVCVREFVYNYCTVTCSVCTVCFTLSLPVRRCYISKHMRLRNLSEANVRHRPIQAMQRMEGEQIARSPNLVKTDDLLDSATTDSCVLSTDPTVASAAFFHEPMEAVIKRYMSEEYALLEHNIHTLHRV